MADQAEMTPEYNVGASKKPGLMTIVKAVAFVSVIVLLQIAAASILVPSAEETRVIANQVATADASKDASGEEHTVAEDTPAQTLASTDMREVFLGSFHVVTTNPDTGASLNVDFDLYATVLADEEGDFFSLYESNASRIREQVLITVRGTEITDLTDPTLGLIKRKILEKTNRALGKPLLHEAVFSKFSFVER